MKIALACDHAGRRLNAAVLEYLKQRGTAVEYLGPPETVERVDYPDYATPVAAAVAAGRFDLGILICGTGTGMAMAANRIGGARAASCDNEFLARMARAHNNANILTLGERVVGEGLALAIVETFLVTAYEGGRHQTRLDKFS